MKITNFVPISISFNNKYDIKTHLKCSAFVDVSTWLGCKNKIREIYLGSDDIHWVWKDTGKWTPSYKVEEAVRKFEAENTCKLIDYVIES